MWREWKLENLIECWTLDEAEFGLAGATASSPPDTAGKLGGCGSTRSWPDSNDRTRNAVERALVAPEGPVRIGARA
ncbi:MAG: hypothetical protein JO309_16020 [Pseudonocardiales bacterium]|nr:hypothetical protein [Pseudonocardiales bacterium]